jgi:predicted PurR-regulated permease PerM
MFNIKTEQFDVSSLFQNLFKAGIIQNLFSSFSSMMGDFFILLVFWIFMIMGKKQFEERLKSAFANRRDVIEDTINSINNQLQSYIIIKTITSLTTGIIVTIILWLFGIDFAIFWGLLTFILNFIPNIGSIIATLFPIVISFLDYGIGLKTISLGALLIINQNIIGNFIEPHYLGKQMDLSPVFVLFSLIFWGWIWGIAGMFLSVPIAAAIKIFFSNIEPLKPISIIMGRKVADINS